MRAATTHTSTAIQVWRACETRLAAIKSGQASNVLQEIDTISEQLCLVLDALNCRANLDLDPKQRDEAREEFLALSQHVQAINTDREIYQKLKSEEQSSSDCGAARTSEAKRTAQRLLLEFEWEGAALETEEARANVGRLQNDLRQKEYQAEVEYFNLASSRPKIKLNLSDGRVAEVDNSLELFQSVMFHERDMGLRKQVFDLHYAGDSAIIHFAQTREDLRQARHQVAQALGFTTHAHFALNKNMANDPLKVETFLRSLAGEIKPIVHAKLGREGMEEWAFQRKRPSVQDQAHEHKLNAFFTLDRSLRGIARLCEHLFHVKLVLSADKSEFKVYNEGEYVGTIELDLLQREGKSPHPCLYPLRTSCKTNAYAPARARISCGFTNELGHTGFRALMHEFGHALHTVLSRTEFQHLSGTRGEIDFIETPSSLMERMAWDSQVISFMDSGEERYFTSKDLMGLERKRVDFAALDLQEQVFHSLFDLNFHLKVDVPENELYWELKREFGSFALPTKPNLVRKEVFFPHVLGNAYAGSVYSYVWGAALTCDLWDKLFARGNALSMASGLRLKRELFEKGGSVHPNQVMTALVGRSEIDQTALLRDII